MRNYHGCQRVNGETSAAAPSVGPVLLAGAQSVGPRLLAGAPSVGPGQLAGVPYVGPGNHKLGQGNLLRRDHYLILP